MSVRQQGESTHPRIFRDGWRAALSGVPRERCPYIDGWGEQAMRKAWLEGYADAERERAKDVADVREAVKDMPTLAELDRLRAES